MKQAICCKRAFHQKRAFSILEVVVALGILSVISLVSTRIIQSSLQTKYLAEQKLSSIKRMSKASNIFRSDLKHAIPAELKNFSGQPLDTQFILDRNSKELTWISLRNIASYTGNPVRKISYQFKNGQLYRKQYFAEHPAEDKYIQTVLLNNITKYRFEAFYQNNWVLNWPLIKMHRDVMPSAIKVVFENNGFEYEWLMEVGSFYE